MNFSSKKILLIVAIFLLIVLVIQLFLSYKNKDDIPLEVNFLNVGQGDAALIDFQDEYQILVDSGISSKTILTELKKVMPIQDKTIEIVIATHYDKDHVGGMRGVFENYEVELFLDNGQLKESEATTVVSDLIEAKKIRTESISENSTIKIGEDLVLTFFNPDGEDWDANDNSVVFRLDYGVNSFLFTGDIGFKPEKDMIADEHNLDVDWLKVGHHGSKNSTGEDFLQKVTPEKSIISVGKNSYGHPSEDTLNRLNNIGSEILTTMKDGLIQVGCWKDGKCEILN